MAKTVLTAIDETCQKQNPMNTAQNWVQPMNRRNLTRRPLPLGPPLLSSSRGARCLWAHTRCPAHVSPAISGPTSLTLLPWCSLPRRTLSRMTTTMRLSGMRTRLRTAARESSGM